MHAWRIIDANANRAAEGLRTIEELARLVAEDSVAVAWVKSLRHRLGMVISQLDRTQRLSARSTEWDAGTEVSTASEANRDALRELLPAAAERVTQALRQLEEFSKLVSDSASAQFKQLRYEAYDVLARTELRLSASCIASDAPALYVLVDCSRPLPEFTSYLCQLAEAGVGWFQLRDKCADGAVLVSYARAASQALAVGPAQLLVNDRVDVSLASNARGVHLGQEDISLADARRQTGYQRVIGVSTHSVEQALAAEQAGADYIGCGPTFPSTTKDFQSFPGTEFVREVAGSVSVPFYAIGGINLDNVDQVVAAGCRRVAVSGVIHQAANPLNAVAELLSRLQV